MPVLVLLRHGRTTANASGVLAGRSPGVELDDAGRQQAAAAGRRLAGVPLAAVVTSPLQRCRQTADAVAAQQTPRPDVLLDEDLTECDYGAWQGRPLAELAQEPLWSTVQERPSEVTFPGGEPMLAMQERAVAAVRRHDRAIGDAHGPDAVWVAVSHGDVIKAVLAEALGMRLDDFQRLDVHPGSMSVVGWSGPRPMVVGVNTLEGDLAWLRRATPSGATVGGRTDTP